MEKYINAERLIEEFKSVHPDSQLMYASAFAEFVKDAPAADVAPVVHAKRIKTRKHRWKRDIDGSIDFLAWDMEFHSGPACIECGKIFCENCESVRDKVNGVKNALEEENCIERTVCSICGRNVPDDALYCNCGAKLDKEVS